MSINLLQLYSNIVIVIFARFLHCGRCKILLFNPCSREVLSCCVRVTNPRQIYPKVLFLRDKPETDMREIAVLRFLCIGCCERSEQ